MTFIQRRRDTNVLFIEFNRGKTMKKVLLTTTALTLAAGVASAEITFSGKGEAGFYRNAPAAAELPCCLEPQRKSRQLRWDPGRRRQRDEPMSGAQFEYA